jgi:hypothetical protein
MAAGKVRAAKAAMEPATVAATAMEAAAVAAPAMEAAAVAAPAMAAAAMRRKGGNWLGQCKNACQSSRGDTQAAGDADPFHVDLLLSQSPRDWRLLRSDLGLHRGMRLARG